MAIDWSKPVQLASGQVVHYVGKAYAGHHVIEMDRGSFLYVNDDGSFYNNAWPGERVINASQKRWANIFDDGYGNLRIAAHFSSEEAEKKPCGSGWKFLKTVEVELP